jgi:hypothetical protein
MTKNYIILAHFNPKQLVRLIGSLNDSDTFFYIHIDKRSEIEVFKTVINLPNVFFLENRIKCKWGDISLVQATMLCMQAVLNDSREGYCILISGQDYPIKTNEQLNVFLKKNREYDFVELLPVAKLWSNKRWRVRIEQYKFDFSDKRADFVVLPYLFSWRIFHPFNVWGLLKALVKSTPSLNLILKKRKFPNYLTPYAGSQWWALRVETVKKIFAFLEEHPDFLSYNQRSFCADEFFFQSILYYLDETNQIQVKPNLTFVNWKVDKAPSPEDLGIDDFKKLTQLPEPYFFARKFNTEKDSDILDQLDEYFIKAQNSEQL